MRLLDTRVLRVSALLGLALGCGEPATPSDPTGALVVRVVTEGSDLDPDGYRLRLSDESSHTVGVNDTLRLADLPAGDLTATLEGVAANCAATLTPAGTVRIVAGHNTDLTIAVTCGAIPLLLVKLGGDPAHPDWRDIFTVQPDGSSLTRVTATSNWEIAPRWAPDRSRLAYTEYGPEGRFDDGRLRVVRADGTGLETVFGPEIIRGGPAWSPDGSRLAFSALSNAYRLTSVTLAGQDRRVLTPDSLDVQQASWSPDGLRLALSAYCRAGHPTCTAQATNLYVGRADGTGLERLTDGIAYDDDSSDPTWSPDSRSLLYLRAVPGSFESVIEILDVATKARTPVHRCRNCASPAWAPDGRRLAFLAPGASGGMSVYVIGIDGSGKVEVPTGDGTVTSLAWR